MINKKTIALLLTSSGCLLHNRSATTNARSLIGLQQQVHSMDQVDDAMKMLGLDAPEVDLQQTLEQNMKVKQKGASIKKKQQTVQKTQQESSQNQDKYHKTGLIGNDNIAAASTEDMYAFSQVLASGGSVNKAVKDLEQEAKQAKEKEEEDRQEMMAQSIKAMKEANKSQEEKNLDKAKAHLHKLAVNELDTLQSSEQTSALASLVDAEKLEIMAESMQGSGIDLEQERKKKAESEKKKQKEEQKKKMKKKQALAQQKKDAKRKALERKKKIEDDFKKLQEEHGGINGTEDTGYDDSAMNAYVKREEPTTTTDDIMLQDDFEVEEYETLLLEHRNHLLSQKMNEGAHYIAFY